MPFLDEHVAGGKRGLRRKVEYIDSSAGCFPILTARPSSGSHALCCGG